MEDRLVIRYDDCSYDDDIPVLTVYRTKGDKYEVVNALVGQEAEDIYKKLTNKN